MKNKIIYITGAGRGIGRALTKEYLKKGHKVVALDISQSALEELKRECTGDLHCEYVDVSNFLEFENIATKLSQEQGKPFIWINNAGMAIVKMFDDFSIDEFHNVMQVNFMGVLHGTRIAINLMSKPERGHIVNIASVNGKIPAPYLSAYGASKHAVVGLTRSLQEEKKLSHSAIKVQLVLPGFVDTDIIKKGSKVNLPGWFFKLLEAPEDVAVQIVEGIFSGKNIIQPTTNGKVMLGLHRIAPGLVEKSGRLIVAKNWKQALGLSPIKKEKDPH